MTLRPLAIAALLAAGLASAPAPAYAIDTVVLTLKDNKFDRTEITVPANERFRIQVHNQDATPAEFESTDLRVEKIIVPGGSIIVNAGPLKPGQYQFFDEYHPDTATGRLTAEAR